jgi:DNA-directed RNA polymerase specialized sigma24 family protein
MGSNNLDHLAILYSNEKNSYRKNKILKSIFQCYEPWARKLYRFYVCGTMEEDDVYQHMCIGICNGLENRKKGEAVGVSIFRNVRREFGDNVFKVRNRKKTSIGKDKSFTNYTQKIDFLEDIASEDQGLCKPLWEEDTAILQIDLERAISKLNTLQQKVIHLWLRGCSAKEINNCLHYSTAAFNTIIYHHFRKSKAILKRELVGYHAS